MLADLLTPFDYPRRSAYNLARAGGNVFTGDASWQDLLRALPAAGGLAALPFLGPLGGAGIAGGLQGLGGLIAPEAFAAPTAADLVGEVGGDPESLLQVLGAQLATDPLTYAGGLGVARGVRGTLAEAASARAASAPPFPKGPMGYPDVGPPLMGHLPREPLGPIGPEVGTPRYEAQVQAAIEADAAASAAAEAMPSPFREVGDAPWVPARPAAAASGVEQLHPDLEGLYGVLHDLRESSIGRPMRPKDLQTRVALLQEIGDLEAAANPGFRDPTMELSPYRTEAHSRRLASASDEAETLGALLYGDDAPRPEYPPLLRGVEWDTPLASTVAEAGDRLSDVAGQIVATAPGHHNPRTAMFYARGPSDDIGRMTRGELSPSQTSRLLAELEGLGYPIDRQRGAAAYRAAIDRGLAHEMARHINVLGAPPRANVEPTPITTAGRLGLSPQGQSKLAAHLERLAAGPLPKVSGGGQHLTDAYGPMTAPLRQSLLDAALRRAGLM